ncbi:MAG: hypothetical protein ACK5KR_08890 [Breznakia sp.]
MSKKETPQSRYQKAKMTIINAKYKTEFVLEFKEACAKLEIPQSHVIRKAMEETIEKAKNYPRLSE